MKESEGDFRDVDHEGPEGTASGAASGTVGRSDHHVWRASSAGPLNGGNQYEVGRFQHLKSNAALAFS